METADTPDTELPARGSGERDGTDEEYAVEVEEPEAGRFSTFLYESSGRTHEADFFAYPDLTRIVDLVDVTDDADTAADRLESVLAWCGAWTPLLWVVQRGVLTQGIDLLPYLIARFDDGTRVDLGSNRHDMLRGLTAQERHPVEVTVDRAALAATVPALQQPLLEPDCLIVLRIDRAVADPDILELNSWLADGDRLHFGYQDLDGNLNTKEVREENAKLGIDFPADRFPAELDIDLDELCNDELRELGWRL